MRLLSRLHTTKTHLAVLLGLAMGLPTTPAMQAWAAEHPQPGLVEAVGAAEPGGSPTTAGDTDEPEVGSEPQALASGDDERKAADEASPDRKAAPKPSLHSSMIDGKDYSAYSDGKILIAGTWQLDLVGSGKAVTDSDLDEDGVGKGKPVTDGDGKPVTYAPDADYVLGADILLDPDDPWQLPGGFSGTFSALPEEDDAEGLAARLHDAEADAIYVQNYWQLSTLAASDRGEIPVMSGDVTRKTFGTGHVTIEKGEDGEETLLTYSDSHAYVLSLAFDPSREKPDILSAAMGDGNAGAPATATEADGDKDGETASGDKEEQEDKEGDKDADGKKGTQDKEDETNETDKTDQTDKTAKEDKEDKESTTSEEGKKGAKDGEPGDALEESDEEAPEVAGSERPASLRGTRSTAVPGNTNHVDGRDWFGQVTATIDGTDYILIGDRQQLDAINSGDEPEACGPVYEVFQRRSSIWASWDTPVEQTVTMVYPGDADLIDGIHDGSGAVDFSEMPLYDGNNGGVISSGTYPGLTSSIDVNLGTTRTIYCTVDGTGHWDLDARSELGIKYEQDGNYIVFRDIDMRKTDMETKTWVPLMFSGTMVGAKADDPTDVSTLWDANKTEVLWDPSSKPTIHDFSVSPQVLLQLGETRLDLDKQTGVGFFGTITGSWSRSTVIDSPAAVRNLRLQDGTVHNPATRADIDQTVVNGLLTGLGSVLGLLLDPVLTLLLGKNIGLRTMLTGLLDARKKDPSSLATGAFAGRVCSNATVEECDVSNVSVTTVATYYEGQGKLVGKGGFVGYASGETLYEGLSNTLDAGVGALSTILNIIPGVGLGDLVQVLLDNALPVGDLVPTGYIVPEIRDCDIDHVMLSAESGKYGVGGFVGSMTGTEVTDCSISDSTTNVRAHEFAGGFVGIARDAIIKGTLSGLGVDIGALHPQSELVRCSIEGCTLSVGGGSYIGGFAGATANSYLVNPTVSGGATTVFANGDYAGGCVGYAHLGTLFGLGDYLVDDVSLLGTVKGLVTGLAGSGSDQSLLDVGGVAPSAIMGYRSDCLLTVTANGAFAGGIVGRGNGTKIAPSDPDDMRELGKYDDKQDGAWRVPLPISAGEGRDVRVSRIVRITAGGGVNDSTYANDSFAGGVAGYLTSANIGGLLGSTVGIGQYLGFDAHDITVSGIDGDGFDVVASQRYAGGGIGWAVGGDVADVDVEGVASVTALSHAGGFVGATGPGDLVSGDGLDVSLLGVSLVSIDNLLSLVSGVRTTYQRADATGTDDGLVVTATGIREGGDTHTYVAGGWAAEANSVRVVDSHVRSLASTQANMSDGIAGGYVGSSSAGGLAGLADNANGLGALQVGQLVNAVPYLVPSYDGCSTSFTDGGFVSAESAGGWTGDFQSGKVNSYSAADENPIYDEGDDEHTYSDDHDGGYSCGTGDEPWSVYGICHVRGGTYAGGWGGKVYSGSLASAGSGLSLLGGLSNVSVSAQDLLGLASVYVPLVRYAGVSSRSGSQGGFSVLAAHDAGASDQPAQEGYAGGFIGYASGAQVSYSDVDRLRRGEPDEPVALTSGDDAAYRRISTYPSGLESSDGSAYMAYDPDGHAIPYSVAGARYAGGYVGHMDVGSAASLGGGLQLLGRSLSLTNVLDALSVVVSTIEHSDVHGAPGGFSVLASSHVLLGDGEYDALGIGHAGGYAGKVSGGHIQDGNVDNFAYIVGEVSAGGHTGEMEPGDVAHVLDSGSLSLLGQVNDLASLVQDFVPTIRNSQTTCIPCGGAVRAQCPSDSTRHTGSATRGMAGGYVGHCRGGQIWGMSDDTWKDQNDGVDALGVQHSHTTVGSYTGTQRDCAAIRIRSVWGAEYAGGYCGLMECGSTAQTGGLSLLGNLLSADNLLGAISAVYPTIRHGVTYGPLEQVSEATWNAWRQYVGAYGSFAPELADADYADLGDYVYGYHVVAGRHAYDQYATTALSGCAGGFVGAMHGGVIESSSGEDAKVVLAMRAAGGFAGEMQTKGLAEFGSVNLLGSALNLNLGNLLSLASVLVPATSTSGVTGYRRGLRVGATGTPSDSDGNGCAGGFVGGCYGGQIGIGDDTSPNGHGHSHGTWARMLREVRGTNAIGGFAGISSAASVLTADTQNVSSGLLQGILDKVVNTPTRLADVLKATMSTVKFAEVRPFDTDWGFVVDGTWDDNGTVAYAKEAGGFAGSLEATVVGERSNEDDIISVHGLRGVVGGYYAGGFFGLADVGSVAQVGGDSGDGAATHILDLVQAGNVSLLDMFRAYVYHAGVTGVADGIRIYARESAYTGIMGTWTPSGAAGGFGGGLMNGTVADSSVAGLNYVEAPSFAGGFVGHAGRNGGVSVEEAKVAGDNTIGAVLRTLGLDLGANAQVLDIVGSTIDRCSAGGFADGFVTRATDSQVPIADVVHQDDLMGSCSGGFVGYGDITQVGDCDVTGYKLSSSPQVAGGFIGSSSVAYIADTDVSSDLTSLVVRIVNLLIKALYLNQLEQLSLLDLDNNILGLKLLSDGDLLYVNLGGIKIGVSLVKNDPEFDGSDAAIVTIGSSTIKVPCDEDGIKGETPDVTINLIEGNRTAVKRSSVTGIDDGYDVFGGGATQDSDGLGLLGYAGGFIGHNDNGFLSNDVMTLCDTVRGVAGGTGPFSGKSETSTRPLSYLEGTNNTFKVYRTQDAAYDRVLTAGGTKFGDAAADSSTGTAYNRYDVTHRDVISSHADLDGATQSGSGGSAPLDAYASSAQADLMLGTPVSENGKGDMPEPADMKDPCSAAFELTLDKVWRDAGNVLGSRPSSIMICVDQVDAGSNPPADLVSAGVPGPDETVSASWYVTLTPGDEGGHTTAWKASLPSLPVAREVGGETRYWRYAVHEVAVSGYRTAYEVDGSGAAVTVRNEYADGLLPYLGGDGKSDMWVDLLPLLGLLLLALTARDAARRRKARDRGGGEPR